MRRAMKGEVLRPGLEGVRAGRRAVDRQADEVELVAVQRQRRAGGDVLAALEGQPGGDQRFLRLKDEIQPGARDRVIARPIVLDAENPAGVLAHAASSFA
jgi:hypothetical protein